MYFKAYFLCATVVTTGLLGLSGRWPELTSVERFLDFSFVSGKNPVLSALRIMARQLLLRLSRGQLGHPDRGPDSVRWSLLASRPFRHTASRMLDGKEYRASGP